MINKDDIRTLIKAHGVEETLDICFEECGELVQAISKMKRAVRTGDKQKVFEAQGNLAKEIADVQICSMMLCETYNITDELLKWERARKMERNLKRCGGRE